MPREYARLPFSFFAGRDVLACSVHDRILLLYLRVCRENASGVPGVIELNHSRAARFLGLSATAVDAGLARLAGAGLLVHEPDPGLLYIRGTLVEQIPQTVGTAKYWAKCIDMLCPGNVLQAVLFDLRQNEALMKSSKREFIMNMVAWSRFETDSKQIRNGFEPVPYSSSSSSSDSSSDSGSDSGSSSSSGAGRDAHETPRTKPSGSDIARVNTQIIEAGTTDPYDPDAVRGILRHFAATAERIAGHGPVTVPSLHSPSGQAVRARLQDGYSVEDLKLAIDGCARTPHNNGQENGKIFFTCKIIFGDDSQVQRFIANNSVNFGLRKQSTAWLNDEGGMSFVDIANLYKEQNNDG